MNISEPDKSQHHAVKYLQYMQIFFSSLKEHVGMQISIPVYAYSIQFVIQVCSNKWWHNTLHFSLIFLILQMICNQLISPSTGFVGVDGGGVAFDDELVLTTTMEVVDPELLLLVVVLLFELILLLVLMLLVVGLTTIGLTGWLDWKKKKNK